MLNLSNFVSQQQKNEIIFFIKIYSIQCPDEIKIKYR